MSKIVRYFKDTDLRQGHQGLAKIARAEDIDTRFLGQGEYLLFVNRAQTAFKMLAHEKILVHYRNGTQRLHPGTFALLPRYFDGRQINYDAALSEALRRDFRIQKGQTLIPGRFVRDTTTPEARA